jgi:hypothetical protein
MEQTKMVLVIPTEAEKIESRLLDGRYVLRGLPDDFVETTYRQLRAQAEKEIQRIFGATIVPDGAAVERILNEYHSNLVAARETAFHVGGALKRISVMDDVKAHLAEFRHFGWVSAEIATLDPASGHPSLALIKERIKEITYDYIELVSGRRVTRQEVREAIPAMTAKNSLISDKDLDAMRANEGKPPVEPTRGIKITDATGATIFEN